MKRMIDDTSLSGKVGGRRVILPVGNDLDLDHQEVGTFEAARNALYGALHSHEARLHEIKHSRMLTDHERATLRVKAFDQFDMAVTKATKSLGDIGDGIIARKQTLKPAAPASTSETTLNTDMQLLAAGEQFDPDRQRQLVADVESGDPFSVRVAEAIVRTAPLARNLNREWIRGELETTLFQMKNADVLPGLRQATIAGGRLERAIEELREVSSQESMADRRAVGSLTSA